MHQISDAETKSIFNLPFVAYSSPNETSRYLCNHRRAYRLFTDSISPKCASTAFPCESYEKFERGECFTCNSAANVPAKIGKGGPPILQKSCGRMGYHSDKSAGRGPQYLLTRDGEPFCGKMTIFSISISILRYFLNIIMKNQLVFFVFQGSSLRSF